MPLVHITWGSGARQEAARLSTDLYASLAGRYDRFHGEFGRYDRAEVAFFRRLFKESGVRRVLDCACGTGGHLPLFHSLRCYVQGSDNSPSMLARARENLAGAGVEVPLHQVDYRQLPESFATPFDAVVCLSSSILHMPDEPQITRAFQSMRAVLRPGGILVLTQGTTDRQWAEKPRFILAVNSPDLVRLFVIDYQGAGATYHLLDVHPGREGEALETWSVDYPRVWLQTDYDRLLHATGFRAVDFYGSYHADPYDATQSRRLIVVAHNSQ